MVNWQNLFRRIFNIKEEEPDPMKYLIVGLGNMGKEYDHTRHNVGFDVVDYLAKEYEVKFKDDNLGDIAEFKHKGRTFILLKPSTFMNRSGKAVRYWMQKKKIQPENLLVIVDDLHLDFERIKLKEKGSAGGHNGLSNINELYGSDYPRLRIGIGDNFSKGRQVDYVLGKWTKDERDALIEIVPKAAKVVLKNLKKKSSRPHSERGAVY